MRGASTPEEIQRHYIEEASVNLRAFEVEATLSDEEQQFVTTAKANLKRLYLRRGGIAH